MTTSRLSMDSTTNERPDWAGSPCPEEEERPSMRSYSRVRSLECSRLEISIIGSELTDGHTLYIIQLSSGIKQWEVGRRFRDFCFLDKQLRKNFSAEVNAKLPPLPPKRYLFSSTDPATVEERRNQLETYVRELCFLQALWARNDLALFLNDQGNSMMFIWNFERMRKMQDTLSSMEVEKESEAAKLNSTNTDLSLAQTQVHALQERLSRMEMLMLQQATGLAAEELSSSAMRTLSGHKGEGVTEQLLGDLTAEAAKLYGGGLATLPTPPRKTVLYQDGSDDDALNAADQTLIQAAIDQTIQSGVHMPAADVVRVLSWASNDAKQRQSMLKNLDQQTPEQVRAVAVSLQLQEAVRLSNEVFNEKFDISSPALTRRPSQLKMAGSSPSLSVNFTPSAAEAQMLLEYDPSKAGWAAVLSAEVDSLLVEMTPTTLAVAQRLCIFRYLRDLVSSTLGMQLFPIGSLVSHTFLPDGAIETSAFALRSDDDSWFVRVNEALCLSSFSQSHSSTNSKHSSFDTAPEDLLPPPEDICISNVSFVNGEVKKIKVQINGTAVDVSMNQVDRLYAQFLVEKVDAFVGRAHLFKRCMLLLEAWAQYESPRLTQGGGSLLAAEDQAGLTPWALTVMLLWVFNLEGHRIHCPVQALGLFLRTYACFDWSKHALTVTGPVSAQDLSAVQTVARFFPETFFADFAYSEDALASLSAEPSTSPIPDSFLVGEVQVTVDTQLRLDTPLERKEGEREESNSPTPGHKQGSLHIPRSVQLQRRAYQQGLINIVCPTAPIVGLEGSTSSPTPAPSDSESASASAMLEGVSLVQCVNLTEAVDSEAYQAVTSALYEGYLCFQKMCDSFAKIPVKEGALPEGEVGRALRPFFSNLQTRVQAWSPSFKRKPSGLSQAFEVGVQARNPLLAHLPLLDPLQAQGAQLEFSLRYAEMVLGARIDRVVLAQLVVRILTHKGTMPVGEVGKNLQAITGCENLSKRLKEQFNGLKRAIEQSNCPRLHVGNEHPFNPNVLLKAEDAVEDEEVHPALSLAHADFVFTPIIAQAALLMAAKEREREATSNASVSTGSPRGSRSFRRQPPFYDQAAPRRGRGQFSYAQGQGGRGARSPKYPQAYPQQQYAGNMPGPMGMQQGMYGGPGQGGGQGMAAQQHMHMQMAYLHQQQQMYQQQMYSLSSSLSSSYGNNSPTPNSPMAFHQYQQQAFMAAQRGEGQGDGGQGTEGP